MVLQTCGLMSLKENCFSVTKVKYCQKVVLSSSFLDVRSAGRVKYFCLIDYFYWKVIGILL